MNGKAIALAALLAVLVPVSYFVARRTGPPSYATTCVAGPGTVNANDICADEAFYQDTLRLKQLDAEVAAGKTKAAKSGDYPGWLQEKQDQLDGMNARLWKRLPRDPKAVTAANPAGVTHVWDFNVHRLVPYKPVPAFDAGAPPATTKP